MSRYAAAHMNPQGPGDSRPTALQIVKDNDMEGKLAGKVIVITGVSSGIGIETVRALAMTGATFYLTARDLNKAKNALADILLDADDRMTLVEMDQTSLDSVRSAAATILAKTNYRGVNILINNAGIMMVPDRQLTKDGYELQFGVNYLSHFLLFQLLKPALLLAASITSAEFPSRVVNVSSSAHRYKGINGSDNYSFQKEGSYDPQAAYAQSKTAQVYMANKIERLYGSRGLHSTSLNPGFIATAIGRYLPKEVIGFMLQNDFLVNKYRKSPEQGAATTVWAAIGKEWQSKGGKYLNNCGVSERGADDAPITDGTYVSHTYSPEDEARLWKDSLAMVGLPDDT